METALASNETKVSEEVKPTQVANTVEQNSPVTTGNYIANSNTGKYHFGDCRYIKSMNESNKVAFSSTNDASSSGYIACKVCRP